MVDFVRLLQELQPYADKFYYTPLSEEEILATEERLHITFPEYFKQFLKIFGLRQDLVFGLYDSLEAVASKVENLPDEISQKYIPFGDNGGEETLMLSLNPQDTKIYHFQYGFIDAEGIVEWRYDFEGLLFESVAKLKSEYETLPLNTQKSWAVQFIIHTNNELLILETLNAQLVNDWSGPEISISDVYSYKNRLFYEGKSYLFSKSEYSRWDTPMYAFTMQEPLDKIDGNSLIKKTEEKIKAAFEKYVMVNYGILAFGEDE
ncbi:SMI1/KNR4 family protein [Oscillatoria amoena NRMC-F 0135]|nr:SMI1/KNR4 family protein [Oscillatoria amoena NRMC-F 0135]